MNKWWGDIEFELNEVKSWRIGSRQIIVQRKTQEWLVWNDTTTEESNSQIQLETIPEPDSLLDAPLQRFLLNNTEPKLIVRPALADRSVIARPGTKLSILPGETVDLYVSTPLWLSCLSHSTKVPLVDLPFWLPSDSWFGLSTMVGELCYAKYTDAKATLENITKRSHRAISKVCITNDNAEPLKVQSINLPIPFLNLYADSDNQFWTDTLHLTHSESKNLPAFKINKLKNDTDEHTFSLVCSAREVANSSTFMRSIRSLVA